MRVIGTAGHVDHGKSTLVKYLTGIDPDRLAEEKKREMTIDLGFAWFDLPNGEPVGIVDVPGHRDFIENMLAGVGSIDAVILVIAADEGIMPQTREHLAIIDLLAIESGIIALAKTDLIDDPDWLDLVEQEIQETIYNTTLSDAKIIRVSAFTGEGIAELVDTLAVLLDDTPHRQDNARPRLPIDRVFTISGFGTVVTGTLLDGSLTVGDEIQIQPSGQEGRIRGLQSHKQAVATARPGSRVAVNIAGIEKKAIARGEVLTYPNLIYPTILADVYLRHIEDATRPLKHNAEVKVFAGAAETTARVRLLSHELLQPGENGWLQLRLEQPLALTQNDRFILRYPSPGQTIGGGTIINPHPGRRWKRFQASVLEQLETRLQGTPAQRLIQVVAQNEPIDSAALASQLGYADADYQLAFDEALAERFIVALPDKTLITHATLQRLAGQIATELAEFHRAEPLRLGMSRAELRSRLNIKNTTLNSLLQIQGDVVSEGNILRLAHHAIQFTDAQRSHIQQLTQILDSAPFTPPSYSEAAQITGEAVLHALIELGELVQVHSQILFARQAYETMVATTLDMMDRNGSVSAASLRDHFGTSRKYAIGLLEYLDSIGITRRDGDTRVRGPKAP